MRRLHSGRHLQVFMRFDEVVAGLNQVRWSTAAEWIPRQSTAWTIITAACGRSGARVERPSTPSIRLSWRQRLAAVRTKNALASRTRFRCCWPPRARVTSRSSPRPRSWSRSCSHGRSPSMRMSSPPRWIRGHRHSGTRAVSRRVSDRVLAPRTTASSCTIGPDG